jgi:hypothetical protein
MSRARIERARSLLAEIAGDLVRHRSTGYADAREALAAPDAMTPARSAPAGHGATIEVMRSPGGEAGSAAEIARKFIDARYRK